MYHKNKESYLDWLIRQVPESLDGAIDGAISCYIKSLQEKDYLTQEDVEICLSTGCPTSVGRGDLIDLIVQMSMFVRETSHGASVLTKVFVNTSLYNSVVGGVGVSDQTVCKVGKIMVLPSSNVEDEIQALGLCQSKFKLVSPEQLVIVGILRSKNGI